MKDLSMVDKENYEKDINVPHKEEIIIDVDEYFKSVTDDYGRPITYVVNHSNLREEIITLNKEFARKTQECEELKRLIAKQKNAKIQLSKLKDKQYKEFCDMKQTLIEIKEIAEENIRIADLEGLNGVYRRGLAKQILQKISKSEVE